MTLSGTLVGPGNIMRFLSSFKVFHQLDREELKALIRPFINFMALTNQQQYKHQFFPQRLCSSLCDAELFRKVYINDNKLVVSDEGNACIKEKSLLSLSTLLKANTHPRFLFSRLGFQLYGEIFYM